jgi:hypothetical protein
MVSLVKHSESLANTNSSLLNQGSFFTKGSKTPFFQAKLTVNEPGDQYEQEADAVADKVMRMPNPDTISSDNPPNDDKGKIQLKPIPLSQISRKCAACEEDEKVQRKESSGGGGQTAPSIVNDVISSSGQALDGDTRNFMESRMGHDFSNVQIHTDSKAAESAASVNALAYTSGNHVVFNSGQYQPDTEGGKRLLAHELVHVGQQSNNENKNFIHREDEKIQSKEIIQRQELGSGVVPSLILPPFLTLPRAPSPSLGNFQLQQPPNLSLPDSLAIANREERTADPCTYDGPANREREIHLNLQLGSVRIYSGTVSNPTYRQFDNLITGPATVSLAETNGWCHMYGVQGKQRRSSRKGLLNFVSYCGNFGFHSNFWQPIAGGTISRIPGTQSHGCARLNDVDETSTMNGDSRAFYNSVEQDDCVRIYSHSFWRNPTFKSCGNTCIRP